MASREQKRAASVERLLDAAEDLFVRDGVANVSLDRVATAAGLTRGAIYWNFADKEDLALAVIARRRRRDLESWERSVDTSAGGGRNLMSLQEWFDQLLSVGPEWFALEAETLALAARQSRRPFAEQTQQVMLDQFTHLVEMECSVLGVARPDDLQAVAELVAALANGLVLAWLGDSRIPVAQLFSDGVVRLLGSGTATTRSLADEQRAGADPA